MPLPCALLGPCVWIGYSTWATVWKLAYFLWTSCLTYLGLWPSLWSWRTGLSVALSLALSSSHHVDSTQSSWVISSIPKTSSSASYHLCALMIHHLYLQPRSFGLMNISTWICHLNIFSSSLLFLGSCVGEWHHQGLANSSWQAKYAHSLSYEWFLHF